jgi:ferredoxin
MTGENQREERRKKRVQETIEWYWNLREINTCAICGEAHPVCIELYHLKKRHFRAPKYIRQFQFSRERMLEEIDQCVFLCANCIRKYPRKEILRRFKPAIEKRNGNSKQYRKRSVR